MGKIETTLCGQRAHAKDERGENAFWFMLMDKRGLMKMYRYDEVVIVEEGTE